MSPVVVALGVIGVVSLAASMPTGGGPARRPWADVVHPEPATGQPELGYGIAFGATDTPGAQARSRRLARPAAVLVVVGASAANPMLGLVVAVALGGSVAQRARRRRHERASNMVSSLAETIDLFAVALANGHNVSNALRMVTQWSEGEVQDALGWCGSQLDVGRPLDEVLESLPDRLGPPVRPLVAALVAHARYGAPISVVLDRLAADARADRRRRAEARARRLPVLMLFPLVLCVLPAFLLFTVVPVVADSLSSFEL